MIQRSLTRGTITGTVTIDGTNTPLAGAQVCARGESHDLDEVLLEAPTCAITDAAGHYQLAQLLPAQYRVGASARTYRPALHHPGGDRHQVTLVLAAGETKANVDIALRGGGVEVTGSVSDVTGGPIVRARVGSYEAPGMVAETDDQGAFRLWVAPGYVSVEARADGYAATSESVRAPGKVALFLTPASSLAGTVVDAASGQPVEGARVQIEARDSTGGLFSDADGAFRVTGLGPGRHVVIAHTERGYGRTEGSTLVGLGEQVDGVVVKLFPSARVEARVQIAATRQPCVEAEATLRDAANNRWLPMKRDPDGQLWLDGVLPGTYTPEITCRGFVARETYPTVAITNAPVTGVVWEVDAGATIRGRVLTKAGTPVEDALVRARTIGGAARSKGDASADLTAREGAYELTGLRPGTYKINVSSQLYVAPTDGSQVEVAAGAIVEKDLVLEDSGLLDGTVVDADGKPVGDVDVVARLVSGGGRASGNGKTDETGRFHLTGLRAGDYRVTAARGWSEPLRKPGTTDDARQGEKVSVRANQTATVRLVIETVTGSITGSVVDALGAPVSDAFVSAARESDAAGGKPSSVQDTRWSWERPAGGLGARRHVHAHPARARHLHHPRVPQGRRRGGHRARRDRRGREAPDQAHGFDRGNGAAHRRPHHGAADHAPRRQDRVLAPRDLLHDERPVRDPRSPGGQLPAHGDQRRRAAAAGRRARRGAGEDRRRDRDRGARDVARASDRSAERQARGRDPHERVEGDRRWRLPRRRRGQHPHHR